MASDHMRPFENIRMDTSFHYEPTTTASTSLEYLLSVTRKFIMPTDLIIRLQPMKKMPKTTVSESTHTTATCTMFGAKESRSCAPPGSKPESGAPEDHAQHAGKVSALPEWTPASVLFSAVQFILIFAYLNKVENNKHCARGLVELLVQSSRMKPVKSARVYSGGQDISVRVSNSQHVLGGAGEGRAAQV